MLDKKQPLFVLFLTAVHASYKQSTKFTAGRLHAKQVS